MDSETAREMLDWAREVEIEVEDCDFEVRDLRRIAAANAEDQRDMSLSRNGGHVDYFDHDKPECFDDYSDDGEEVYLRDHEERQIVNLLRHDRTNYDKLLEELNSYVAECSCADDECIDGACFMDFEDERTRAYWIIRRRVHEALVSELPQYEEIVESIISQERHCYRD